MALPELIGTWVEVFLIIGVLSILYKENILFRLIEHLYVGVAAGYTFNLALKSLIDGAVLPLTAGNVARIVPLITGLLTILIFSKRFSWLSRYGMAILLGIGLGYVMTGMTKGNIVGQLLPTIRVSLADPSNVILVVAVFTSLFYFIFHLPRKGAPGVLSRIGRYFIMLGFGASYGTFVFMWIVLATTRIYTILKAFGIV
jgi:hypothetical protein